MSRGSVCSWEPYARRSSANMMQFSGSRAEFMICDEIEYKRKGGWFLSYAKTASIIAVFILAVVAAGCIGWYISSIPKRRAQGAPKLIDDEIEDAIDTSSKPSAPSFVHPLRYRLELTPFVNDSRPLNLTGRVLIEFLIDGTDHFSRLQLNAKNINVTHYQLFAVNQDIESRPKSRRKREDDEQADNSTHDEATDVQEHTLHIPTTSFPEVENRSVSYENETETTSESVYLNTERLDFNFALLAENGNLKEIEITEYLIDDINELHVIEPSVRIGQGKYFLEIHYEVPIENNNGIHVANFTDKKWLMTTRYNPVGARYIFPVLDDVNRKARFSVSIAHPNHMKALSNMPVRSSRDSLDDLVLDTYNETPLLSPHNLAFAIGDIELLNRMQLTDGRMVIAFWGDPDKMPQDAYLPSRVDKTFEYLVDIFQTSALPKVDLVALPPAIAENTGSPGLISMKESLFYVTQHSSKSTKMNALKTLIRMLGKQWLGGLVNMKNWTDVWILESSLIHFQHQILSEIDSSFDSDYSFVADIQSRIMDIDGYSISKSLKTNINPFYWDPYNIEIRFQKGACLIRMLHTAMNETAFRNGYKEFVAKWKYKATDQTEFWKIMAEESNELSEDVIEIINSWISQSGYPVITVTRNYENGSAVVNQIQFTYDNLTDETGKAWYIPLTYTSENGTWSEPTKTWFMLEEEKYIENIGASNESWVVFNVNKTGYYRVNYDEENWMLLTSALEENHEAFPPETRASLIDDVFSLAAVGFAKYETAFGLIKYMQMKERHYAPWCALMYQMFKLNNILYDTSVFPEFQDFMLKFVSPLYEEVGSKIDEGSQLTHLSIQMACMFEHTACLNWSTDAFVKLKDASHAKNDIPSYLRETIYCTVARYGTRDEWNYFIENVTSIVDSEEKNRILSSFACFQVPWILQSVLNEILQGAIFSEDEIQIILRSFPQNPAAAQTAYRFVRSNWQDIAKRFANSYPVMKAFVLASLNGLNNEQDLQDLQLFWENNYDSMKLVKYSTVVVDANANFIISWLKDFLPEVQQWLKDGNVTQISK